MEFERPLELDMWDHLVQTPRFQALLELVVEVADPTWASQQPTVVAAVAALSIVDSLEQVLKVATARRMAQMAMEDLIAAVAVVVWEARHLHPLV